MFVRAYKKHSLEKIEERKEKMGDSYKPFEAGERFDEYQSKHDLKQPRILKSGKDLSVDTYEIDACCDKYIYKKFEDSKPIINHKSTIWIGYRFPK